MPGGPCDIQAEKGRTTREIVYHVQIPIYDCQPFRKFRFCKRRKPYYPFGAKLRKYKLDELLELWNVLIGDMSFVGPRPDVPGYADKLEGDDRRMLLLKPGITGPASLKYRDEEELLAEQENPQKYNDEVLFPDKVRINIEYLDNWSFWNDIKIIIYTILGKDL